MLRRSYKVNSIFPSLSGFVERSLMERACHGLFWHSIYFSSTRPDGWIGILWQMYQFSPGPVSKFRICVATSHRPEQGPDQNAEPLQGSGKSWQCGSALGNKLQTFFMIIFLWSIGRIIFQSIFSQFRLRTATRPAAPDANLMNVGRAAWIETRSVRPARSPPSTNYMIISVTNYKDTHWIKTRHDLSAGSAQWAIIRAGDECSAVQWWSGGAEC